MLRVIVGLSLHWLKIIFIIQVATVFVPVYSDNDLLNNEDVKTAISQFVNNFKSAGKGTIKNYQLKNDVVKAGDNMLSGIYRLNYSYKKWYWFRSSHRSVILKIPSLSPLPHAMFKHTNMFDREIHFYTTLLPKLYQLDNCKPFSPELYACTAATALVLEDLSAEGYKPGDRVKQLDMDHSRLSLDMLAKYHALTWKYLQTLDANDPSISLIGSYQPTLAGKPRVEDFDKFCNLVGNSLDEPLYQKVLNAKDKILEDPLAKEIPDEISMTVIIHADFRTNNILFKYKKDRVCDAKLIDWQLSRKASPVLDLIYFFVTSVPIDDFEANNEELMNRYLDALNQQLQKLKTRRKYDRSELDSNIVYYKYYYLKVLVTTWQQIMRAGIQGGETNQYVTGATKWLHYLDEKGFI